MLGQNAWIPRRCRRCSERVTRWPVIAKTSTYASPGARVRAAPRNCGGGGLQRSDGDLWRRRAMRRAGVTVVGLRVVGGDERGRPRPYGAFEPRGVADVDAPRRAAVTSAAQPRDSARGQTCFRGCVALWSALGRLLCEKPAPATRTASTAPFGLRRRDLTEQCCDIFRQHIERARDA